MSGRQRQYAKKNKEQHPKRKHPKGRKRGGKWSQIHPSENMTPAGAGGSQEQADQRRSRNRLNAVTKELA